MRIPILSIDPNIKRYRYTSLLLPSMFSNNATVALRMFLGQPNPYCCRSLEEWSNFFGVEVKLLSGEEIQPALIGWEPGPGYNR
jgi:hypothetical protein